MKKNQIITLCCLLLAQALHAQEDWRIKIKDEWFLEHGIKSLKPGDRMPDIPLGKVLNNTTGKTRFSDFKGKLVILDFWNTACKSCIAAFPKMERIQKEFGDKIQIILVNLSETENEINSFKAGRGAKVYFPDLPCIVKDWTYEKTAEYFQHGFAKYFRMRGVPFHVWVDGNGIIRVVGNYLNTYPEKIEQLLRGEKVYSMGDISTTPFLFADKNHNPYYNFLGDFKETPVKCASIFTPYNNELSAAISGNIIRDVIDSTASTVRTSLINVELLSMYMQVAVPSVAGQGNELKSIYIPGGYTAFVKLPRDMDTFLLTTSFFEDNNRRNDYSQILKDKDVIKSTYCYEQVLPLRVPKEQRRALLFEDLNRFLLLNYGLKTAIEKRKVACYQLVRISDKDKVAAKKPGELFSSERIVGDNGKNRVRYWSVDLGYWMETVCSSPLFGQLMTGNQQEGKPSILLDRTGWEKDKKMDVTLPQQPIDNIDDLNRYLAAYDLAVTIDECEINYLVFSKMN